MRPSLVAEIREFLTTNGPSTSREIALGLRARRTDVDQALTVSGFERTDPPVGATGRGTYWKASQLVPARRGGKGRAARMLDVLRDGRWHSRREILELSPGEFFLTNNAAAELRRQGKNIVYDKKRDAYRLAAAAAAMRAPAGASISGEVRAA